jgi:hypothetical protein
MLNLERTLLITDYNQKTPYLREKEGLVMAESENDEKAKGFGTRRNVLDIIFILGFILALITASRPVIFPVRANLTIYIDHFEFSYDDPSVSNSSGFTVFLKIVNDSPKSANIFYWNFSLNIKIPYQILNQTASRGLPLVLPSSAETDLSMTKTLIGENGTAVPNGKFQSILVSIHYEDGDYLGGILESSRSYDFPYN